MGAEPVQTKKGQARNGYAKFVHLRVRSVFSLLEGAVKSKELAKLAREMHMPAVAVTDTNNLFGAYEISEARGELPEPIWPDYSFGEILKIAFRDRLVDRADHPLIQRLLGIMSP